MKKAIAMVMLAVAVPAIALAVTRGGGGGKGSGGGEMRVQVREAVLRTAPNYLSASAGTLAYGSQVEVAGEEGNWYRIASPSGWLPKSALTSRKVAVNPGQKFGGSGARHDEVALAGKGFNPQVEAQYKRENADLAAAYASVDRIEGFGASEGELRAFQSAGKLRPR